MSSNIILRDAEWHYNYEDKHTEVTIENFQYRLNRCPMTPDLLDFLSKYFILHPIILTDKKHGGYFRPYNHEIGLAALCPFDEWQILLFMRFIMDSIKL